MAEDHFGGRVAPRYDETVADMFDPSVVEPAVDFLAEMAGSGRALELAIGTGRIALPLAGRGVRVHGIDLSVAMVEPLGATPGGTDISVTLGDFATTTVDNRFSLAYLVFNTIMNLTNAEAQVGCFCNAAAHLEPGGRFVIEVGMPQLQRLLPGETVRAFSVSDSRLGFDQYDVTSQRLVSHHYSVVDGHVALRSVLFPYVWPSELDLMPRLAGMTRRERWGGWKREPFASESIQHVSVREKPSSKDQVWIGADEQRFDLKARLRIRPASGPRSASRLDLADLLQDSLKTLAIAAQVIVFVVLAQEAAPSQRLETVPTQIIDGVLDPGRVLLGTPHGGSPSACPRVTPLSV
jgi:Methyltransferase domain